ncbi:hypothetical protein HY496_01570 [Candidatus Woesearchaeota archaeon]|nr:hypothetical protein [Candidatus Woesearchaeota archaeon]
MKQALKTFYEQKYKTLLLFPLLLIVLALVQIGVQTATTGDFVNKGITLKGGSTITLVSGSQFDVGAADIDEVQRALRGTFPQADINVRALSSLGTVTAVVIDSRYQTESEINPLVAEALLRIPVGQDNASVEIIGSALGESFFTETLYALLVAFLLMGAVVFFSFRLLIPSVVVIAAALSDIIVTLAVFNLTGLTLSTAGVAAFLMLIGYSVDTDILLTNRVLKRKEGTVMERIYGAINTGMTMTLTTMVALVVALFFVQSELIKQIMIILVIGLIVDVIMTWIQNVGMLRLYLERKEKKGATHGQK